MNDVKKPSLAEMIAWQRGQAVRHREMEDRWRSDGFPEVARGFTEVVVHHEAAAEALELLAEIAQRLADCKITPKVLENGEGEGRFAGPLDVELLNDEALRILALAKIGGDE